MWDEQGILSTRGTRDSNEDRYSAVTLELPHGSRLHTMKREANRIYFGVFDGYMTETMKMRI